MHRQIFFGFVAIAHLALASDRVLGLHTSRSSPAAECSRSSPAAECWGCSDPWPLCPAKSPLRAIHSWPLILLFQSPARWIRSDPLQHQVPPSRSCSHTLQLELFCVISYAATPCSLGADGKLLRRQSLPIHGDCFRTSLYCNAANRTRPRHHIADRTEKYVIVFALL